MKLKLEMTFDIPEELYQDDVEDKDIPADELKKHWLGFAREAVFGEFISFAYCMHLKDALECLVAEQREQVEKHKIWAQIIFAADKTSKFTMISLPEKKLTNVPE